MNLKGVKPIEAAIFTTLILALLVFFFLPVKDTDFGWHYRCGEDFLAQGKLCLQNEYAYFLPNYQWAYSNFIYDISLAFVYDHFSMVGISILGSLIFTSIFSLLFFLYKGGLFSRVMAILVTISLSHSVLLLGYRSQILGLLFLVLELAILEGPRPFKIPSLRLFFLELLFLIWANSHPSFFLGPLILSIWLSWQLLESHFKKKGEVVTQTLASFSLLALSVFVTTLNPFGWRIYQEVVSHFLSPLNQMIAEWVNPGWPHILLITILTSVIIFFIFKKKIPLDYKLILLVFFAYFAVSAKRNLPLYYIIALWLLSETNLFYLIKESVMSLLNRIVVIFLGLLIAWMIFIDHTISYTIAYDTNREIYCRQGLVRLPCKAVDYFQGKSGNIFNMYEDGGFLVWKLPQMKVFVDGRMPAWQDENGKSPYLVYLEIIQTQANWNEKLAQYKTDYLLINVGTFLELLLQKEAPNLGWLQGYRDQEVVIYQKD